MNDHNQNNTKNSRITKLQNKIRGLLGKSEITQYIGHIILSILLGLAAGAGAILFHLILEKTLHLINPQKLTSAAGFKPFIIVLILTGGAILTGIITKLFPKTASEKGILSVIKSIILNDGFIKLRVTLFHLVAPIISIGSGAPLGPEGPVAKIGSGIGSFLSQMLRLSRKDMMMYTAAGSGAAISAVFNAPIAGVFFGIEVILLSDLKNRAVSAFIIASVMADVLSRAVLGNKHIFNIPKYSQGGIEEIPLYLLLGVFCGIFSLFYLELKKYINWLYNKKFKINSVFLKLVPVSFIFGLIVIKYYQMFGIGYETINSVLNGKILLHDIVILLFLKIIFLALFLNSGAYGGTFAPSLSIGAFLGYSFALTVNALFQTQIDPVAAALVAMGGVLAGINSAPLTAIMLVFEVTNDYTFILPLMLASIIAYLVIVYYYKGNVYANDLLNSGIDVTKRGEADLLGKIKVASIAHTDFELIDDRMPFKELLQVLLHNRYADVFVVNAKKELLGIISLKDVRQALLDNDLVDLLIARDLTTPGPAIEKNEAVSNALLKLEKYDVESIPVINSHKDRTIVGILTHQDIIQAYNTLLEEWETSQFLVEYGKHKK